MKISKAKIAACAVTYAVFCVIVYLTCRHRLVMSESLGTFYFGHDFTAAMLRSSAGLVNWLSLLVTQFFANIWAAVLIYGALLAVIAWLTGIVIRHITGDASLSPLSLLPSLAICWVQPDIYCTLSYTISFVLMLMAIDIVLSIRHQRTRFAIGILMPLLLINCAGAVAILYALCITAIEAAAHPRSPGQWLYALTIPMVLLLTYFGIMTGVFSDFAHALTPAAYYMPWLPVPRCSYLPWLALIAVVAVYCSLGNICLSARRSSVVIGCAATIGAGIYCYAVCQNCHDELYAELMAYADRGEWKLLSERYVEAGLDDMRLRNLYNLSLAERGQLSKTLFSQSCSGPETLLDISSKRPDRYMLLGDIFYSMGHIAMAQKHTFEANEGFGNLSPRLLKRLADLNIITGQYAVADKYLNMLADTWAYSEWACGRLRLLYDDAAVAAHPDLGPKQRCLTPSDRLCTAASVESDLIEVLRHNPSHRPTMEYLGMLTLLRRDVPTFTAVIEEMYGTPALSVTLPKHYQEAIAIAALASGDRLDITYRIHPSTMQQCRDFWSRHTDRPGTFWHYLRAPRQ